MKLRITQINLGGIDLISSDYKFVLTWPFDFDKDVITNDLMGDGQAWGRSKNKAKSMVLSGRIKSWDPGKVVALNRILVPNSLKPMIVSIIGIGQLICYVEVVNRATGGDSRSVSIQLTMPDPCLYELTPQCVLLGGVSDTPLIFPATLPWTLGGITGAEGTLSNDGNVVTYPVFTIIGDCSNIFLKNWATREVIFISAHISDADTLIVDCRPSTRGVYLNGQLNIGLKTNAGWISASPGDNKFRFSRSSTQNKQHCSVELQSRWM